MLARTFIKTPASSSSGEKKAQKMVKNGQKNRKILGRKNHVPEIFLKKFFDHINF